MPLIQHNDAVDEVLDKFGITSADPAGSLTPSQDNINTVLNSCGASAQDTLGVLAEIMNNDRVKDNVRLAAVRLALEVRKIIRQKDTEDQVRPIHVVVKDGNVNVQNIICPPGRL